jgi:molecular chaperone DnaJ
VATQDFYKVLGVPDTATPDEIKKAYRKLAKQFHPDAKPNDAKAAERFKEISEAHTVLSDEEKKAKYDRMRRLGAFDPTPRGGGLLRHGRGQGAAGGAGVVPGRGVGAGCWRRGCFARVPARIVAQERRRVGLAAAGECSCEARTTGGVQWKRK